MKLKKVEELDGTEIAAVDVCSNSNLVIIPKGSKLKKEYVSGLIGLEILTIFVEEDTETLNRMDPEIDGRIVPLEVMDYYIRHFQHIVEEKDQESTWDPIKKFDLLAKKMIHYMNQNRKQKIQVDTKRDADVYEHTIYVTLLVLQISIQLSTPTIVLYQIVIACLLHDLGLVIKNVPCHSLDEKKKYDQHPISVYEEISENPWISKMAADMILYHHEKRDGSGFPYNRKKLPRECEILQAADLFDRFICGFEIEKKSLRETKELLQNNIGTWYDKEVINILFERIAYED